MNRLVEVWKGDLEADLEGAVRARAGPTRSTLLPGAELLEGDMEPLHGAEDRRRAAVEALFLDQPRATLDQLKAGRLYHGRQRLTDSDVRELVAIIAEAMWKHRSRYLCMVSVWLRDAQRRHRGNSDLQLLFDAVDSALHPDRGGQLEQAR